MNCFGVEIFGSLGGSEEGSGDWAMFNDTDGRRPSREQIAEAAYHRWERRGGDHGGDRDDWAAVEKDLVFALNYRYIARYKLSGRGPVYVGRPESERSQRPRRCRFCEQAEPSATFRKTPPVLPPIAGNSALFAWDECDECHGLFEAHLAGPFEAFARPLLRDQPRIPSGIPVAVLKVLVRAGISVLPVGELHHFGDTSEWVSNPDHDLDAALLHGLGCYLYLTPEPVPSASIAVSRRVDEDSRTPYAIVFLALAPSRIVLQAVLPLCTRDEDLEDGTMRGPELSMSLGQGRNHRASESRFLPVIPPDTVRIPMRGEAGLRA